MLWSVTSFGSGLLRVLLHGVMCRCHNSPLLAALSAALHARQRPLPTVVAVVIRICRVLFRVDDCWPPSLSVMFRSGPLLIHAFHVFMYCVGPCCVYHSKCVVVCWCWFCCCSSRVLLWLLVGSSTVTHVVVAPHGYDVEWLLWCFPCGSWLGCLLLIGIHVPLLICIIVCSYAL